VKVPSSEPRDSWSMRAALAVLGTGNALPGDPISTDQLLQHLAVRFGVDVRRRGTELARLLGISTRHLSRPLLQRIEGTRSEHSNAELSAQALRNALTRASARVSDLDYLIAHTATPGQLVPPNVAQVARLLSYTGPYVEIRQACTGFANALVFANGVLAQQPSGLVAIVGSETGSVYFDPLTVTTDKGQLVNLIQMGDGAAAIVLGAAGVADSQITEVFYGCSREHRPSAFHLSSGGSDAPAAGLPQFEHNFQNIRRYGPSLFEQGAVVARTLGIDPQSMDYVIPHQANGHLAAIMAQYLGLASSRVFVNAGRVGNTGSAAIWLAFDELLTRVRAGESVLAFGAEATAYMFGGFRYVRR
jgi:3-oxoacyl-[acyl-carrier-protein] synthase III